MNNSFVSQKILEEHNFKSLGSNIKISSNVTIIGEENITLGSNVRIDDYTIISAKEGSLNIGSNVHIGGQSYLGCSGTIKIGNNVNISQGVKLYSKINNYHQHDKDNPFFLKKIVIKDEVIIGSGTVIVGECCILDGTTIGALSLVKDDLKSWSIYAGNPLRFLKSRKKI